MKRGLFVRAPWPKLPGAAWNAVAWRTLRHSVISVVVSMSVCTVFLEVFSEGIGDVGLIASALAPLVLGTPMIFVMSMRHHELRHAYARLEAAARRDSLTGCLNHGAFLADVTARLADTNGALLLIDADHFKLVNDTFGHATGDTALRLLATAITANAGPGGLVGRLGGEEFGLFLPGAGLEEARRVGGVVRAAIEAITLETPSASHRLTVSIGGIAAPAGSAFDALFRVADAHLYRVKRDGRNNVSVTTPDWPTAIVRPAPEPVRRMASHRTPRGRSSVGR